MINDDRASLEEIRAETSDFVMREIDKKLINLQEDEYLSLKLDIDIIQMTGETPVLVE